MNNKKKNNNMQKQEAKDNKISGIIPKRISLDLSELEKEKENLMMGQLPFIGLQRMGCYRSEGEHQPTKRPHPEFDVEHYHANRSFLLEFDPFSPSKPDCMKSLDIENDSIEEKSNEDYETDNARNPFGDLPLLFNS